MKEKKYEIIRDHPLRKLTKDALSLSKNGKFISTLTDVDITDAKSALRELRRSGKTNISFFAYLIYCVVQTLVKHPNMTQIRTSTGRLMKFNFVNALIPLEIKIDSENILVPKFFWRLESKSPAQIESELEEFKFEDIINDPKIKFFLALPKPVRMIYYKTVRLFPKLSVGILGNVLIVNDGIVNSGWGVGIPFHTTGIFFGAGVKKIVKAGEQFVEKTFLNIHVSTDHRLVDGAPLFRFTNDLRNNIRHFYKNLPNEKTNQRGISS